MSFVEKASGENDQKEPEIRLHEDDESNESDSGDQKDKNMRLRDRLKTSQREKRTVSPLRLFKEDFSQFKEEMLKVFKDKDMKTEDEDCLMSQAENKPAGSTLGLLKDDLNQLREDITSVFSISSSKDKETKSAEKATNRLSFLKEDLNHFKDNLSNVFRVSPLKDRDTAKEESSETFKRKVSKAERTDEAVRLFRRDQKTSQRADDSRGVRKTFSETSEEQMNCVLTGNLSEQSGETVEKIYNNMKDRMDKLDMTASEETTSLSETQQSEELISASRPAEDERTYEEEEEEEEPSEADPWERLFSEINLFDLRDWNRDDMRNQPGDLWSVKNCVHAASYCSLFSVACYLTFDPNTANSELHLTDGNRKVTRVWLDHRPSDHPDRFARCPQVLCREGLLDSVYWEVMWSGGADIGITYNSISRDGDAMSCLLGHNEQSWSLECSEGSYTPCHNNKRFRSSSPKPFTHRVGVYLDWSAGSLSFYCVSQDTMVHLHTFTSTFTEPVYPGFWVWAYNGSVSLCQVELNWERLLQ